jgi:hypothetical protein
VEILIWWRKGPEKVIVIKNALNARAGWNNKTKR